MAALTEEERDGLVGVGHRVVHGGSRFSASVVVDDAALADLHELVDLAPLHMPANLLGIETARAELPGPAAGRGLRHRLPPDDAAGRLPLRGAAATGTTSTGVRRYGFHGTSHRYVSARAAELLGPAARGAAAGHPAPGQRVQRGRGRDGGESVDTTMGLTPLEGLVMGTRSGDVDPGVLGYVAERLDLDVDGRDRRAQHPQRPARAVRGQQRHAHGLRGGRRRARSRPRSRSTSSATARPRRSARSRSRSAGSTRWSSPAASASTPREVRRRGAVPPRACSGLAEDARRQRRPRSAHRWPGEHSPETSTALVVPTDEELVIARDTARRWPGAAMTRTLLVVPTGHGVGLTATCLGLVHALERQGVKVGFYKPLAQPRRTRRGPGPLDRARPARPPRSGRPSRSPPTGSSRRCRRNELDSLLEDVVAAAEPLLAEHDVVVVEGLVPGSGLVYAGRTNVALAKALDADVLLVGAPDGGRRPATRLAETMAITARTYQGRRARPGRRRRGQPGARRRSRDDRERSAALLARRDLALVGAVPFRPELALAAGLRRGRTASTSAVLNEGETGPAGQGRHRRRAGGARASCRCCARACC